MKVFLALLVAIHTLNAAAQGTAFTYQGALNDAGGRANGTYDFTFALYDSTNQPGNLVAGMITNQGVMVANSLFTANLDFGSVFDGNARWLQMGVRTNGAVNFITLSPRQLLTPVPYAIFSGATTNLVGPLSTANLAPVAALIASASNGLSSAFSTNLASFTNSGLETPDDVIRLASVPDQQEGIQRTPIRGYLTWYATGSNPTEESVSNTMYLTKTSGLYNYGYNWIFIDDGWGTTNRDTNGNVQWDTNKFPSGSNFVKFAHSMGYKLALYTDGGFTEGPGKGLTSSGAQAASDITHVVQDVNQFLAWGLDGGKWDFPVLNMQLGMSVLATNTSRPFYVISGYPYDGSVGPLAQWASLVNAFRGVGGVGDVTSFGILLAWCDQYANLNFYRWIRPGHVYDFDGINLAVNAGMEPGTAWGTTAQVVMDAISSGIMLHSFANPYYYATSQLTNASLLAIQGDPAVIGGKRVMQTNFVDVWLKPLGSEAGPEFAIGMICRGVLANVSVTVPLGADGLNLPAASQLTSFPAGYSVYDCLSNVWVSSTAVSSLTVTLTNCHSALFRLYPGTVITTNYIQPFTYAPTLPAIVVSNGAQRVINVPWDRDAADFIARAQLTNDPVQCYAAQFLFTKLKSIGLWTNRLDVLYPMLPAQPYLNAFSTNFTLVPVGSVTTNALGIAGNGSDSYFTNGYHFINSAIHFSRDSASVGVYNGTATPTGTTWIGGLDGTSETCIQSFEGVVDIGINDLSGNQMSYFGDAEGLWVGSRVSSSTSYMAGRPGILTRNVVSVSVPNSYIALGGEVRNGIPAFECNVQMRGAWVGGGLAYSEIQALNGIWDEYEAILGRAAQ